MPSGLLQLVAHSYYDDIYRTQPIDRIDKNKLHDIKSSRESFITFQLCINRIKTNTEHKYWLPTEIYDIIINIL